MNNKFLIYICTVFLGIFGYKMIITDNLTTNKNLLFYNGSIITMETGTPSVEAVYVENGIIQATGDFKEISQAIHPNTKKIDLDGQTLLPGFIDSHTHPVLSTFMHGVVDLSGFTHRTKGELWKHFEESVSKYKPGDWILCSGFDQVLIPELEPPDINYLDSIAPNNPVLIVSHSLHSYWVNSIAFRETGVNQETLNPSASSYYEKDENGNLTGYIVEQEAFNPFKKAVIQSLGNEILKEKSVEVLEDYAKNGYSTIISMGITTSDKNVIRLYKHLSSGKPSFIDQLLTVFRILPKRKPMVRNFVFVRYDSPHLLPISVDNGDDFFKILGIKFWYDGSPYTGSMYLESPYLNSDLTNNKLHLPYNHSGESLISQKELESSIIKYQNAGWQIAIHSQGDIAIKEILESFNKVTNHKEIADYRHRLEHCLLLQEESIQLMANLNIHPSFHINHLYYYGEALKEKIIGKERTHQLLPIKKADDHSLIYSVHADQPMFPSEPLNLLHIAVNRRTKEGKVIGAQNAISVKKGLKALTINAAWQIKMEDKIGSIKKGKYADFVILNQNPFTIPTSEIQNIKVLQTIVNGRTTYVEHSSE